VTLFVIFLTVLFLASGAGLAYVVGAASVMSFIASDNTRYLAILPQRIFSQLDVFVLMAMVLFILVGEVMNRTGVSRYLIEFSMSIVGRLKGGLGHVNILTSIFFAGVSGSAVADAAALSTTLIPAMRDQGYTSRYAGAVTAASSIIGHRVRGMVQSPFQRGQGTHRRGRGQSDGNRMEVVYRHRGDEPEGSGKERNPTPPEYRRRESPVCRSGPPVLFEDRAPAGSRLLRGNRGKVSVGIRHHGSGSQYRQHISGQVLQSGIGRFFIVDAAAGIAAGGGALYFSIGPGMDRGSSPVLHGLGRTPRSNNLL